MDPQSSGSTPPSPPLPGNKVVDIHVSPEGTATEVRIDVRLEGTSTDKASQNGHKPISFHGFMRITNQSETKEVHVDMSSEGTTSDKASQDGHTLSEVMPIVKVNEKHRPLFEAAVNGHWKATWKAIKRIICEDREHMNEPVMTVGKRPFTVLEFVVIVARDQYQLIEKLVDHLGPPYGHLDRAYRESFLRIALYDAARTGRITTVKKLVKRVDCGSNIVVRALSYAISNAPMQKEVIWHLAGQTQSAPDFHTMSCLILAGHLDIGLFLARKYYEELASQDDNNRSLLGDLAKMKSHFRSGDRLNFWEKCIYTCIPLCLVNTSFDNFEGKKMARALKWFKTSLWNYATMPAPFIKRIGELKLRHECSYEFAKLVLTKKKELMEPKVLEYLLTSGIILDSASRGTHEIVQLCLDHFPELMWDDNFLKELMKEVVNGRQVELFRLVNAYDIIPKLADNIFRDRKLMEAIVKWSPGCVPADVPGAAFLMQRELQWFKVLEDMSDPSFKTLKFKVPEGKGDPSFKSLEFKETKERGGKTYWEVFVEQRQDLLKEAGQWMKDTSSSCSLIATLIITVAFAAAFTVPGGNDDKTGIPNFLKKDSFMAFVFADALALFSSVTATVMFLAIVTPCYTVEDILHSLPRKMIMGITFLFLSLVFMLVAFVFALTIVLSERFKWIYISIPLLAAVPVCFFLHVQFPLYVEMVKSIYWPRLCRPLKLGKKIGWDFNFSKAS